MQLFSPRADARGRRPRRARRADRRAAPAQRSHDDPPARRPAAAADHAARAPGRHPPAGRTRHARTCRCSRSASCRPRPRSTASPPGSLPVPLESFTGPSVEALLARARQSLGSEAEILAVRTLRGPAGAPIYQVLATDTETAARRAPPHGPGRRQSPAAQELAHAGRLRPAAGAGGRPAGRRLCRPDRGGQDHHDRQAGDAPRVLPPQAHRPALPRHLPGRRGGADPDLRRDRGAAPRGDLRLHRSGTRPPPPGRSGSGLRRHPGSRPPAALRSPAGAAVALAGGTGRDPPGAPGRAPARAGPANHRELSAAGHHPSAGHQAGRGARRLDPLRSRGGGAAPDALDVRRAGGAARPEGRRPPTAGRGRSPSGCRLPARRRCPHDRPGSAAPSDDGRPGGRNRPSRPGRPPS